MSRTPPVSTDSDIIRRSAVEPAAFAEVFERHARVVGAFAARRVGVDAAEDVLSETMLVAFRRRRDFDATWESARPWLLGIASRVIKKHRADEARQWRSFQASASRGEHSSDGALDAVADRADASASVRALAPRIAALASRDRDVLLLYAWADLTYDEIAVALGVPVGTVRSRLNRVRRKLAPPGSHASVRLTWIAKEETDGAYGTSA
ncbi:RNA polymerase sigma factor [Microbacterium kyungheense]|uniref:RNA polymerase sigma-70 factor (ECF subfamily) n=1 Tax=Microbacterium kyungheense TaxID=1263636 RepID=A0A543FM64_9MICO|nr:sigma-70 family RNA polymerase sigma factor [Microbacterium kyungheense]TQM34941.1 RNA polymerase sigma-70 factor (ECF subfamily) [Microbacterium kyungheense]